MADKLMAGWLAVGVLMSSPVGAQATGQVTMYSNGRYKGAPISLVGPTRLLSAFTMKSVKIPAGTAWEFCSGNTFSGCREIGQSTPALVMTVRSARPVAPVLPASAGATGSSIPGGQSLRGMSSEYFVAPGDGQGRIQVPDRTAEAGSRRAIEFCEAHGWRAAAYQRVQSIGALYYLADVLCVDN